MSHVIIIILLIILNAIFTSAEVATIAANELKVENDANNGNKKAKRVLKLINKPKTFLSAVQIIITLTALFNGYLIGSRFSLPLTEFIQQLVSIKTSILQPIMVVLIVLILSFFQIVFGKLVPKKVALKYPEKIAYRTSFILVALDVIFRPFVWLLQKSANVIGKLFKVDSKVMDNEFTEEQIRTIISTSTTKGVIDEVESKMIENILDFDDKEVLDVMKHRTEISAIDYNSSKSEIIKIAKDAQYTRFPVYKEDIDNVVGILHAKDLLRFINNDKEVFNFNDLLREPVFVTKTMKLDSLLNEMKQKQLHMAIVIDEYGGTAGIITLEDLIEEIVGDIFDEYDDIKEDVIKVKDDVYIALGLSQIEDVEAVIKADLPIDEYDTMNGFILGEFKRFPHKDEKIKFTYNNFQFEVLDFSETVVEKVKITRLKRKKEDKDKR